jgi:glycosyltransferase involved in cell wall biosynthesis
MASSSQSISSLVSVIIPAFNEEAFLPQCLRALNSLDLPDLSLETIVVDNASTDNTVEIAQSLGATVLIKTDGTIASLRNHGAKSANGTFYAFLDADCVVPPDWLVKSIPQLIEHPNTVLGYRLSIPTDSNWVARCWDLLFIQRYFTTEADWIPSGNMIMLREPFMSIDGFDESLRTNEDYDLCFRLRENGYKIISSAETTVTHLRPPKTLQQIFMKEIWHGKDVLKVFIKDLLQAKNLSFFRRKNFFTVSYAVFNLACIILILLSFLYSIITGTFSPFLISCSIPIFVSLLLSIRKLRYHRSYKMLFGVTTIYLLYGFARALTLFSLKSSNHQ